MDEYAILTQYIQKRNESVLCDPDYKLHGTKNVSMLHSSFYEYYNRYIIALNYDIQLLRRYERSLHAWMDVGKSNSEITNEGIWKSIVVDYMEPMFRTALDLPIEIKEKIYQASWKLSVIAARGIDGVAEVQIREQARNLPKYQLLKEEGIESEELAILVSCLDKLYGSKQESAKALECFHGNKHHDVIAPLFGSLPSIRMERDRAKGMMIFFHSEECMDLCEAIGLIDKQRLFAQEAYNAFIDYVEMLIIRGVESC